MPVCTFAHHVMSRFRWVFCQLETLREAVHRNLRGILAKLPRALDETYERVLKGINENTIEHARRLLHCLAVAIRPLRVEELAAILAFDFDDLEGGIPTFHADWQLKDQEGAVLSTCSSLISVVDDYRTYVGKCRVVQFSTSPLRGSYCRVALHPQPEMFHNITFFPVPLTPSSRKSVSDFFSKWKVPLTGRVPMAQLSLWPDTRLNTGLHIPNSRASHHA
jgi:hypothetical protein